MQETWVGKIPWRRAWQLLPGESHGQRSLAGYSPWSRKESDTTERLSAAQQGVCIYTVNKELVSIQRMINKC